MSLNIVDESNGQLDLILGGYHGRASTYIYGLVYGTNALSLRANTRIPPCPPPYLFYICHIGDGNISNLPLT